MTTRSRSERLATVREVQRTAPTRAQRLTTTRESTSSPEATGRISVTPGQFIPEALRTFLNEGFLDLEGALRAGVPIEDIQALGVEQDRIGEVQVVIDAGEVLGGTDPIEFLSDPEADPQVLLDLGHSPESVSDWQAIVPFHNQETGEIRLTEAVRQNVDPQVLERLFERDSIIRAQRRVEAEVTVGERNPIQILREPGGRTTLENLYSGETLDLWLEILPYTDPDTGQIDLLRAIQEGVPQDTLERIVDTEAVEEGIQFAAALESIGDRNLTQALQQGVDTDTLITVGYSQERIEALRRVLPFISPSGQIDLMRAVRNQVPREFLEFLFEAAQVQSVIELVAAQDTVGGRDLIQALRGGVPTETLILVGFNRFQVEATSVLLPFINEQGQVDIRGALESGIPPSTLEVLGIDPTLPSRPAPSDPTDPRLEILERLGEVTSWSDVNAALARNWVTEAELLQIGYTHKDLGVARSVGMTEGTALWIRTMSEYGWSPNELASLT